MEGNLVFGRPLYVMAKPAGAACNLRCKYCYYLEKSSFTPHPRPMSDEVLESFVRQYIAAQTTPEVNFTWHGGEPLLRPISFYEKALHYQRLYAGGRQIVNCIQTNGTLLDDRWGEFLKRNNFLVGISLDGPASAHDALRQTKEGTGSYADVMRGLRILAKYRIEWNAMAVVNSINVKDPVGFYRFFRDELDCQFLQFTPIVERTTTSADGTTRLCSGRNTEGTLTPDSVTAQEWGDFLCAIFDEWLKEDVGSVFIQLFDSTLANWVGAEPGICTMSKYCGHAAVLEANGDLYSCDHFVFEEFKLGNILSRRLSDMMYSKQQDHFGAMKHHALPRKCRECGFEFACHGECPKNRFIPSEEPNKPLNYLCQGYKHFFSHAKPYMDFMKQELLAQRAPANVMRWAREQCEAKNESQRVPKGQNR